LIGRSNDEYVLLSTVKPVKYCEELSNNTLAEVSRSIATTVDGDAVDLVKENY